jgi:ATP-dependent Clp protease ATP-binding subunit ClpA
MEGRPGEQAVRLGHTYIGDEHYLLALLATPSIASETLEELGITHERVAEHVRGRGPYAGGSDSEPRRRVLHHTPAAYGLTGRAEAFAATARASKPRPEHWLQAIVWSDAGSAVSILHHLGASQLAVLDGLRRRGVAVPEVEPPLYRPWRGTETVEVSEDEGRPLLKLLRERHPPGSEWRWGTNWKSDEPLRVRVMAEEGIDLQALVRESRGQAT